MKLIDQIKFLQQMSEDNLARHSKETPIDLCEIAYHEGQLSVLDVLIPRVPLDVDMLEEKFEFVRKAEEENGDKG